MSKNQILIPKKRFKGFSDEWEDVKLDNIYNFGKGKNLSLSSFSQFGKNKGIAYGHLYTIYSEVIQTVKNFTKDDGVISKKGDILFPGSSTVSNGTAQANALMLDGIHLGGDVIIARPKYDNIYAPFISYMINGLRKKLFPITVGTTITHMYGSDLSLLNYSLPSLPEQTKIGQFFENIDKKINYQEQKTDKLKDLKKSYLNKMFPKEGKVIPELRFKGFNDEWKLFRLAQISKIVGGGTPSTANSNYWNGNIDWYSPLEIGKEIYAKKSIKRITEQGLKNSAASLLPKGKTILFTSRASIGDMAILGHVATTNQGFQSIVLDNKTNIYFFYSMGTLIKEFAIKNASGSTFLEISGKTLSTMPVFLPSLPEQTKIGNFFQKLDNLISLNEVKLNKLKDLKKSYLNEMFVNN